jgi:hypothetical protein
MSESRATAYLTRVLALAPDDDAAEMLRARAEYLSPDDPIVAVVAGESAEDFRTRLLHRLHDLRRNFWQYDETELQWQLEQLQSIGSPDVAIAAQRLLLVAQQRSVLNQLRSDPSIHPAFVASLVEILVAPHTDANQIRDREQGWMRPERNPQHHAARLQIVAAVHAIRTRYPSVFALEESWLTELLAYNPEDEKEDEATNTTVGYGLVGFAIIALFLLTMFVLWLFV